MMRIVVVAVPNQDSPPQGQSQWRLSLVVSGVYCDLARYFPLLVARAPGKAVFERAQLYCIIETKEGVENKDALTWQDLSFFDSLDAGAVAVIADKPAKFQVA